MSPPPSGVDDVAPLVAMLHSRGVASVSVVPTNVSAPAHTESVLCGMKPPTVSTGTGPPHRPAATAPGAMRHSRSTLGAACAAATR